jgi:hypothetical protein
MPTLPARPRVLPLALATLLARRPRRVGPQRGRGAARSRRERRRRDPHARGRTDRAERPADRAGRQPRPAAWRRGHPGDRPESRSSTAGATPRARRGPLDAGRPHPRVPVGVLRIPPRRRGRRGRPLLPRRGPAGARPAPGPQPHRAGHGPGHRPRARGHRVGVARRRVDRRRGTAPRRLRRRRVGRRLVLPARSRRPMESVRPGPLGLQPDRAGVRRRLRRRRTRLREDLRRLGPAVPVRRDHPGRLPRPQRGPRRRGSRGRHRGVVGDRGRLRPPGRQRRRSRWWLRDERTTGLGRRVAIRARLPGARRRRRLRDLARLRRQRLGPDHAARDPARPRPRPRAATPRNIRFGAGDLTGMVRIGAGSGCLS